MAEAAQKRAGSKFHTSLVAEGKEGKKKGRRVGTKREDCHVDGKLGKRRWERQRTRFVESRKGQKRIRGLRRGGREEETASRVKREEK